MSAKPQQLAPQVTHWFTPVKPVTLVTKVKPTSTLSVLVVPAPATHYTGSLRGTH